MALPDLCFPLSISWCFQFDRFIANNSDTNIWGQSKELVLLDLNIWNGSLCYCFVIILSKSLVLALVSVVILVISFSKWPWLMWGQRGVLSGVSLRLILVCQAVLCCSLCAQDWQCPGAARLDWAHLQGLCLQSLHPLCVPAVLTEEVLNFSPIPLESLARSSVTSIRIQTARFLSQAFRFNWKINTRMWEICLLDTV